MDQSQTFLHKAAALDLEKLKERALALHRDKIQRIKDFAALQPDHPFTAANRGVLDAASSGTWNAAGMLSMTGLGGGP